MNEFRAGISRRPKSSRVQPLVFKKGDTLCNICRLKKNLTYDHVPPKCCGNDKSVVARRIYADELTARQVASKSLNGLKFKTICKDCNSDLLGRWDTALGEFSKQVERVVAPSLVLPECMNFNIQAGAVLRSILGHVVASKVRDDVAATDQKIREYLLGKTDLDSAIKVYCWFYPFEPTVVSRDFTFVELEGEGRKSPGLVSVVKFYPLAFCVLDGSGNLNGSCLTAIHQYSSHGSKVETAIDLQLSPIVESAWPERATGNHMILGGKTYVDSVTTAQLGGASVTPGKRVQAERWEGGDTTVFDGLHAFAEILDSPSLSDANPI